MCYCSTLFKNLKCNKKQTRINVKNIWLLALLFLSTITEVIFLLVLRQTTIKKIKNHKAVNGHVCMFSSTVQHKIFGLGSKHHG